MKWLILILLAVLARDAAAQATFHGNNARTGVYDSPGPRQFGGVNWAFKTEGPVVSSPAVVDGVVYVGSSDRSLYAIDQQSGTQKWKAELGEPIVSSPAVANGLVYVLSSDGTFYALTADSGKVKWRFSTAGEHRFEAKGLHGLSPSSQFIADPMDLFLSSPAVFNGRVYFGSSDGNVYALDALTGVTQWSFTTGDIVHASPAIVNGTLYIGSWDSYLYALDVNTGREKWRFKAGEDPVIHNQVGFQSSPAVVDGVVYVGCRDGHLYAIDAATGKQLWQYATSQSWVNVTPTVKDGVVYAGTADTHRFLALDAKTGHLRFVIELGGLIFGSAALGGDMAFTGAFNGKLYAIDTRAGKIAWEFRTNGSKADPLKLLTEDGSLIRGSMRPTFRNFMDMTVSLYKQFTIGAVISTPVIDRGVVYFGSTDGYVYAIR